MLVRWNIDCDVTELIHGHGGANQMLKKCWVFEPKNENVECKYFFHASILDVEHSNG